MQNTDHVTVADYAHWGEEAAFVYAAENPVNLDPPDPYDDEDEFYDEWDDDEEEVDGEAERDEWDAYGPPDEHLDSYMESRLMGEG